VVELALKHNFLLHGLLSLSALHLALLDVDSQQTKISAIKHHDAAVAAFQPQLTAITADNYDAVFAFFVINAFYSFAQRRLERGVDIIDVAHQTLTLIRDGSQVAKLQVALLHGSRWAALIPPVPFPASMPLAVDVEDMLACLGRRVTTVQATAAEMSLTSDDEEVYPASIQALRYSLTVQQVYKSVRSTLTLFLVGSPAGFWALVKTRQPLALAILANYAVSLHRARTSIWIEGWGRELVDAVREILPSDWHDCIGWAVRATQEG
jgi:hypothetical protein